MLKHVGSHNNRKVAILYHQVPGEDHMCLLVYSDLLPRMIHDQIMTAIESAPGQQATNLADALFRVIMADGRNALEVIHKEGFMKKVQTSQVIMTPTPASTIRLDELNNLLTEMAKGDEAKKRLAEADASTGMQTKKRDNTPQRNVGEPAKTTSASVAPLQAGPNEVLSDEAIATQRREQAAKMRADATALLAESARLESEAAQLMPTPSAPGVETATEANAPA